MKQLSKSDLELWTGLTREHIKALRAGKIVTDRFPNQDGRNYLLVMGLNHDPKDYAPIEMQGWEVLLVSSPRKIWQQFKKKHRKMTVQLNLEDLIIHVHIWSEDNLKIAQERSKRAK